MDYLEAEMEARIFPSVDIDQLDLLEDFVDEDLDIEEEEEESPCPEGWDVID